jgi:hypothetical protein
MIIRGTAKPNRSGPPLMSGTSRPLPRSQGPSSPKITPFSQSARPGISSTTTANSTPHSPPQNIWLARVGTLSGGTGRIDQGKFGT